MESTVHLRWVPSLAQKEGTADICHMWDWDLAFLDQIMGSKGLSKGKLFVLLQELQ